MEAHNAIRVVVLPDGRIRGYTRSSASPTPAYVPAGTDRDGCKLRVVGFVTPVPVSDVLDYYATRAADQGFAMRRTREGDDETLEGAKGTARYAVIVRRRADGLTQADLVTSGF